MNTQDAAKSGAPEKEMQHVHEASAPQGRPNLEGLRRLIAIVKLPLEQTGGEFPGFGKLEKAWSWQEKAYDELEGMLKNRKSIHDDIKTLEERVNKHTAPCGRVVATSCDAEEIAKLEKRLDDDAEKKAKTDKVRERIEENLGKTFASFEKLETLADELAGLVKERLFEPKTLDIFDEEIGKFREEMTEVRKKMGSLKDDSYTAVTETN